MRVRILAALVCLAALAAPSTLTAQEFVSAGQVGGLDENGEGANAVVVDRDGNVTVAGSFDHTSDVDPGPGTYWLTAAPGIGDVFIVRYDHGGHVLWGGVMGGPGWDSAGGLALDAGADLLLGVSAGSGSVDADPGPGQTMLSSAQGQGILVKVNRSTGHLIWARQVAHPQSGSSGAQHLGVDPAGNIYVAGAFNNGTVDCDPDGGTLNLSTPSTSYFISKLDSGGALVWARQLGGASLSSLAYIDNLQVDAAGNLTMVGRFMGTVDFDPGAGTVALASQGWDGFIVRWDTAGNFVWARRLGGSGDDEARRAALDEAGNIYVTGYFHGTADFDPGPGSFLLTAPDSHYEAFAGKYSGAGNLVWAAQLGGPGDQAGDTLIVVPDRGIITTGRFTWGGDFDPGPGTAMLEPPGGNGTSADYTSILDTSGKYVSAGVLGLRSLSAATVAPTGDLYQVGLFAETDDFDPGPGTYPLTPVGRTDGFISRLGWPCPRFTDTGAYGQRILPAACARDAFALTADLYDTAQVTIERGSRDRFFLSSSGGVFGPNPGPVFVPLVADDSIRVNGVDLGLGPYSSQPGVPPVHLYTPIEATLVPVPAPELGTAIVPSGTGPVQVDILDIDRNLYGHTGIYLVRDCGLALAGSSPTELNWMSHDAQVAGANPAFEVRRGLLSHLQQDRNFSRSACLGSYAASPAVDDGPDPAAGDGYYYMARGLDSCVAQGYGTSSLVPDPRAALDASPACP